MENNIPIKLQNWTEITWNHPVIIIWPNWSWKTTYWNTLSRNNNAEWIWATRNLQFSDSIAMQTPEQAINEVTNQKNNQKSQYWTLSSELNQLVAKLKAEDADSAIQFRNKSISSSGLKPETTKIIQLTNTWNSIFPKREIDFSSYSPKVKANHNSNNNPFWISRMSSWERVALYLLSRVLDAPSWLIFIDEPEIHFHWVLAKKFWNELEILRSDCRFIYITHDLPFAVSRNNGQFIIVYSETSQEILEQDSKLPDDIIEDVLWAATFSVSAKNIIFCEWSKWNKRDDEIYSAYFKSEENAVIPVWSCEEVIKCVEIFNKNQAIQSIKSIWIIDRDFRSNDFLGSLPQEIHILQLHEIESLFCLKDIFLIVWKRLWKTDTELNSIYNEIINDVIIHFSSTIIEKNKIILERVKQKTEWQSKNLLNSINNPNKEINEIKNDYLNALKLENWNFKPEDFFDEEKEMIEKILTDKNINELLKIFPWKTIFGKITQKLWITSNNYLNILITWLNDINSDIRNDILDVLKIYLPNINESNKK